MYKHGGYRTISRGRPAPSSSPSPSPSPSHSSSPALSSNPQALHADGQHGHNGTSSDPQQHIREELGHIGPSFNPQQHIRGPTYHRRTASPLVPPLSVQHLNDDGTTDEEDGRFMIHPYGNSFMDATYVVRQLNKIINNFWRGSYITYSSAPKEVKDLWWNEFRRKFRWDEMEEDEVRRIYKKKASDHIRNVMNKAKTSQVKPNYITSDDWTEIKRTWETKKYQQLSKQNKQNRASSFRRGSATYAGGSINIMEYKKRMAEELGREPTYTATFERTFKKKNKTWTGNHARAIKENFDELSMSNASGGDGVAASEQSVDSMASRVEASGGIKRGKIFGMRSLSRVYTTKATATSSSSLAGSRRTQHEEQMERGISHLKHLLVKKDEEIGILKQQMQFILRHLNIEPGEIPPAAPTNHTGDEHNDDEIVTPQSPSR